MRSTLKMRKNSRTTWTWTFRDLALQKTTTSRQPDIHPWQSKHGRGRSSSIMTPPTPPMIQMTPGTSLSRYQQLHQDIEPILILQEVTTIQGREMVTEPRGTDPIWRLWKGQEGLLSREEIKGEEVCREAPQGQDPGEEGKIREDGTGHLNVFFIA